MNKNKFKNFKNYCYKNKKVIISSTCAIIFLIVTIFIMKDYKNTQKVHELREEKKSNLLNSISEDVKKNIPKGTMPLFLNVCTNMEVVNPLFQQEDFRKALFFCFNRKEIAKIDNIFSPACLFYSQEFWLENPRYLPEPYLPETKESKELFNNIQINKQGYDFEKALSCLNQAYDKLDDEQKKQNYQLNIFFEIEYWDLTDELQTKLKKEILSSIKKLFDKFSNKLKIIVNEVSQSQSHECDTLIGNISLKKNLLKKDYLNSEPQIKEIDYYFAMFKLMTRYIPKDTILQFDFSEIKEYLDNKEVKNHPILQGKPKDTNDEGNQEDGTISNEVMADLPNENKYQFHLPFSYETFDIISYPSLNKQGIWEGNIREFVDFMRDNLTLDGLDGKHSLFKNLNPELSKIQQKTYQKIFEKIFNLIAEKFLLIPIIVRNDEK